MTTHAKFRDMRYPLNDPLGVRTVEACTDCDRMGDGNPVNVFVQQRLQPTDHPDPDKKRTELRFRPLTEEEVLVLGGHVRKLLAKAEAARKRDPIQLPGTPKRVPPEEVPANIIAFETRFAQFFAGGTKATTPRR